MKNKIALVGSGNISNDMLYQKGSNINNDTIVIPTIDSRIHITTDKHISDFKNYNKLINHDLIHIDTEMNISDLIIKDEGDNMNERISKSNPETDITKEAKSYNATDRSDDIRKCRNKDVHVVNVYEDSNVVLGNYGSKKSEQHFIDIGSGMLVPYKQNLDNRRQMIFSFDETHEPVFVRKYDIRGYEIKRDKE